MASKGELVKQDGGKSLSQYQADAGAGFEGTDASDFLIPFIGILQKGSPQVDDDSDTKIPGAKAGMIFNTATQDLYDGTEGIRFIPAHRDHKFVEWIPRDNGGGFVGSHQPNDEAVMAAREAAIAERGNEFGGLKLGDNDLNETFYLFGILIDAEDNTMNVVIPFGSTQIKAYKTLMMKARGIKIRKADGTSEPAPLWAHRYKFTTFRQENAKGSWHGWRIQFDGATASEARIALDDPLYEEARLLHEAVSVGRAQADIKNQQPIETTLSQDDTF